MRVKSWKLMRSAAPASLKAGAELGELRGLGFFGRFHFKIDDGAAGFGGFEEDFEFGGEDAGEVAAELLAAAGGDGGEVAVARRGTPGAPGSAAAGLGRESRRNSTNLVSSAASAARGHISAGVARLDGDAELAQPGPGNRRRRGQMQPCWNQCETWPSIDAS